MKIFKNIMLVVVLGWVLTPCVLLRAEDVQASDARNNEIPVMAGILGKNLADWYYVYHAALKTFKNGDVVSSGVVKQTEGVSEKEGEEIREGGCQTGVSFDRVLPVLRLMEYKMREHIARIESLGVEVCPRYVVDEDGCEWVEEFKLKKAGTILDEAALALQVAIDSAVVSRVENLMKNDQMAVQRDLGNGTFPLLYAVLKGYGNIVQVLLDAGADANVARERDGATPLMVACAKGHVTMVKLLLAHGAVVTAQDAFGGFPLWYAFNNNSDEIKRLLLEAGADVNQCNNEGQTVLMRACYASNECDARWVVHAGADVNAQSNGGTSVLLAATIGEDVEMVRFLLEQQADPNKATTAGGTPLILAAVNGNVEIVRMLLDAGANPAFVDAEKGTALDYASNAEIRQMLKEALRAIDQE